MDTTIPLFLAVALPVIVTPIAAWDARLSLWIRLSIAVLVSLIGAICWAFYVYALTPDNASNITWSVVVYIGVLAAGPMKPLYSLAGPKLSSLFRSPAAPWSTYAPEEGDIAARATGIYPAVRRASLPDQEETGPTPSDEAPGNPPLFP